MKVTVKCYGTEQTFESAEKAKEFYLEAMLNSEGSEHERYSRIYGQLSIGKTYCSDEVD